MTKEEIIASLGGKPADMQNMKKAIVAFPDSKMSAKIADIAFEFDMQVAFGKLATEVFAPSLKDDLPEIAKLLASRQICCCEIIDIPARSLVRSGVVFSRDGYLVCSAVIDMGMSSLGLGTLKGTPLALSPWKDGGSAEEIVAIVKGLIDKMKEVCKQPLCSLLEEDAEKLADLIEAAASDLAKESSGDETNGKTDTEVQA